MIDIIPKPVKETPRWQILLFYILVLILITLIVVYFALGWFITDKKTYKQTVENDIAAGKSSEEVKKEKRVLGYRSKIKRFIPFFEEHIFSTNFFNFLEANTHPRIFFFNIDLTTAIKRVSLSGQADSFLTLGQQLFILEESTLIEELALGNVSIPKGGGVEFNLQITFKPELFSISK
jgi:hypothetical protein